MSILFLILQFIQIGFGQGKKCSEIDSNLCYVKEKYPISKFAIEKKFESRDSIVTIQTPLLADMDGDCIPELIMPAYDRTTILIINSQTGVLKWKFSTPAIDHGVNGLAVADIDGDGILEIFFEAAPSFPNPGNIAAKLFCYHGDGKLVWISDQRVDLYTQFRETPGGTPALADFNQDGIPEIYVNNKIFNARTGIKLADGGPNGIGRGVAVNFAGDALTIAAQLDEDSTDLELAAGYTVYKVIITNVNGMASNTMTPYNITTDNVYRDGYTSIADVNLDGRLDVLVTCPGLSGEALLYAYTISKGKALLVAKTYPQGIEYTGIGPAFIGDIKGSGKSSILITRFTKLLAYSYDGTSRFQLDWSFPTTDSSGFNGLTMFDFNQDGIQEIVYRDETDVKIINGSTTIPNLIAKIRCLSPTWSEYPIVGDIDNSGHAKICVTCSESDDWIGKLNVYGPPDSLPGWAPARGIWNQYNYHVLNINDDLTVPRVQKNNATYKNGKYNNFYVQESLLDSSGFFNKLAASLTGKIKSVNYNSNNDVYIVTFDIYNRSDASTRADSNLAVSFYNGDPVTTGTLIGIYHTSKKIDAGDSLLNLKYTFAASNLSDLFMVINTIRNKSGAFDPIDFIISECDYSDNTFRTLVLPKDEKLNPCKFIDTNLCYIKQIFKKSKIILEKKWESERLVLSGQSALIADIDGDCFPEIITYSNNYNRDSAEIIIIDSKNGKTKNKFTIYPTDHIIKNLLIADVNNDGTMEILYCAYLFQKIDHRIVCYNVKGKLLWISNESFYFASGIPEAPTLGLADFNRDGISEVYCYNRIFNAQNGVLLADGGEKNGVGNHNLYNLDRYQLSIAAQLDQDSSDIELAAGFSIYKIKLTNLKGTVGNSIIALNIQVNGQFLDGRTSVADINQDGQLDVIVIYPDELAFQILYVFTLVNNIPTLLATFKIINSFNNIANLNFSGTPSIADIDGDGRPNILLLRENTIDCFSYNNNINLNLNWSFNIDNQFACSSLPTFDLDGDGIPEIIHRGDSLIYIIDGSTNPPVILDSKPCFAATYNEYSTIADIDNTGSARICITCDNDKTRSYDYGRLTVFGSPDSLPGWAPARPIWNQYAYNPLYINDDLTVPQFQKNQATYKNGKYNNFMQQESLLDSNGMYRVAAASLLGQMHCINYNPLTDEFMLTFDVINKKDASKSTGDKWYITFYDGNPENGGVVIDSIFMSKDLKAGDTMRDLVFSFNRSGINQLFMVVNTSRLGGGTFNDKDFKVLECDYTDNISSWIDFPIINEVNVRICEGKTYAYKDSTYDRGGKFYYFERDTNGCDKEIAIIDIMKQDTVLRELYYSSCDSLRVIDTVFFNSGKKTWPLNTASGCDSTVIAFVEIRNSSMNNSTISTCDSIAWNNQIIKTSGTYTQRSTNANGCDSTNTLNLTINNSKLENQITTTCGSYTWNNTTYTQSGSYTYQTQTASGCDSTITLQLTIDTIIREQATINTCNSYNWNGILITQDGIYIDTFQSIKGCDSIITLELTINQTTQSTNKMTSCDSIMWNGKTYNQSGTYNFISQNAEGCDSIATLNLIINQSTNSTTNMTACDSLVWNNNVYKQSGTYQFSTLNASGCDSIATLKLIINPSNQIHIQQTACNSYTWNGTTYTQSGTYNYKTINSTGCDSIITLDLNIIPSSIKDTSITICDSITFLNKTLNANGNYTFTLQNTQGCDSVINLNLNINSQHYRSNVSTCGSYQWNVNGTTYDSSGMYIAKYTNHSACDSTYLLDLIIHKNYEIKEKAEVCNEYFWPVNKVLYTQSGDYIYPLKTNYGCDSIIKLNLLVNPEFQHADTVITTDAYTWPVNQKTYPTSGTYKEIYQTQNGCDSIHLLLLSINKDVSIYYPNIIHPGGLNSYFTIYVYGASANIKTLSIYDRWGERIWQKQNFPPNELQQGWDGKYKDQDVMPGVYVWHAEIVLKDGSVIVEKGDVTVVR